jgi:erythrocyte band 7 integral membrane protein
MQRSMAAEAEASREARAKVIAAEGEQKASRQLKEAADVISTSPVALQLRYLQTLTQIAAEKNSTIVFPIPGECLVIGFIIVYCLIFVSCLLVELLNLVKASR